MTNKRVALLEALDHLDKGDWQAAHTIVQSGESKAACWAHGIVHVMEGDLNNARYWFGRAQRVFSEEPAREIAELRGTL